MDKSETESLRRRTVLWLGAPVVASLALAACSGGGEPSPSEKTPIATSSDAGACPPFRVYAQNRWAPVGAAERAEPNVLATKRGGFAGNEVIAVNGWRDTDEKAYPDNPAPWDSDVWLHTTDGGWVAFAAVREKPTELDPTSRNADGGMPVTLPPACELK